MATALWRLNRRESYAVLGIEKMHDDGLHADIVVDYPTIGPAVATLVPLSQIEGDCPGLPPTANQVRSIVRALIADFTDHSDTRRCGCGARDSSPTVAQAGAGGAASATNFHQDGGSR